MSARLPRDAVAHHLEQLRSSLTRLQVARLEAVVEVLGEDGRFRFRNALDAVELGTDTRGQDAFREFRQKVNDAARRLGVDLALELDSRKVSPDERHGWFSGGDLVDEEIAAFTGEAAARTGIDHPVAPEVAELGSSRRTRVYVSMVGDRRRVTPLLDRLRTAFALDPERTWELAYPDSVVMGDEPEAVRDRLHAEADVRVALLSPTYLADAAERRRGLVPGAPVVVFALTGLPDGPLDLGSVQRHEIRRRQEPWVDLRTEKQRRLYVDELVDAVRCALAPPRHMAESETDESLAAWVAERAQARRSGESRHLVPAELAETSLRESRLDVSAPDTGPALRAVDRLVDWATDGKPGAPRLCALLGDVGMGKTTTAKLFTRRLLDLRAEGRKVPLPILFDLRDVRVTGLIGSMTLDAILDSMLDATRPAGVARESLCATVIRKRLASGEAVIIFDGLDEVLVHLSPHDQQLFARQLWRALDDRRSRMLLTCRTQYFRTIRDQTTYFTGQGREGLRGDDYLALLMLPFRDEQIRDYLLANLGRDADAVDGFLATISAVHDLPELTRRPMTLRLIADQVEFIETAKLEGRELRAVDLYGEVVDRWLARDSGKHTLIPDHKRQLMEEIAAGLWRSGRNEWSATEVDDWLLALLDRRPDIRRHYREHVPDLWKADFRTATFLNRKDDLFAFGHRSLFEYFLARYLLRALRDGETSDLAMPVPSAETLDFLGQSIAGAPDEQRTEMVAALSRIGERYTAQVSEVAFIYALRAEKQGNPHQSLVGVRLAGAALGDARIGSATRSGLLPMAGADLSGANLNRAVFQRVDLTGAVLSGADLTNAELSRSQVVDVRLTGARAVGTILRECALDGTSLRNVKRHRMQVLLCHPVPPLTAELLVAPLPATHRLPGDRKPPPKPLVGPAGAIRTVTWSPDGARLMTGGEDAVHIWDLATGHLLHQFAGGVEGIQQMSSSPDGDLVAVAGPDGVVVWDAVGHNRVQDIGVRSRARHTRAAWSGDGALLAVATRDGDVQVWDTTTWSAHSTLPRHIGVVAVAWSPQSGHLAVGEFGGNVLVWDVAAGRVSGRDSFSDGYVRAMTWSANGRQLVVGGSNGLTIWSVADGRLIECIGGGTTSVSSIAGSPDGRHLATAGDGGIRIWDVAAARPSHTVAARSSHRALAWSPDSNRLVAAGANIEVWDVVTNRRTHRISTRRDSADEVAWSPDGTRLATAGVRTTRIWDVTTTPPRCIASPRRFSDGLAWSPDSTQLALTGVLGTMICDAVTGEVRDGGPLTEGARRFAWSPDGARIATTTGDAVQIWDASAGTLDHELDGPKGSTRALVWSPNGAFLAVAGLEGVQVWDPVTRAVVESTDNPTTPARAVSWSPDGARLAILRLSRTEIWHLATRRCEHTLRSNDGIVRGIAWSPVGSRLATAAAGGTQIWDAETGEGVCRLGARRARAVAWSPAGNRVVTSGDDGAVRMWDATTGRPVGHTIVELTDREVALFDAEADDLVGASPGAWRWLGYTVVENGRIIRLPAETCGPLPPLRALPATIGDETVTP